MSVLPDIIIILTRLNENIYSLIFYLSRFKEGVTRRQKRSWPLMIGKSHLDVALKTFGFESTYYFIHYSKFDSRQNCGYMTIQPRYCCGYLALSSI